MSVKSITTDKKTHNYIGATGKGLVNDFVAEFLTEAIPHYAADPEWRSIFHELANLSEEERAGMLQQLENSTIPIGLVSEEQLSIGLAFLRFNLKDPVAPRMMVKMIDYYENYEFKK